MSDPRPTLQCSPTRDSPRQQLRGSLPSSWSAGPRQDGARRCRWGVWLASPPSTHNPHFPRTCKPKFNSHDITSLWGPQSCGVRWAGLGPCLARGPRPSGKCPGLRWLLRNAWLSRRARGQRKVLTGSTFLTDAAGGPGPSVTSSLVFLLGSSSTWSFACGQVREGTTAKLPGPF